MLVCRCSLHLRWFRISLKIEFSYRVKAGLWLRAKCDLMEGIELLDLDKDIPEASNPELLCGTGNMRNLLFG